jgi:hypothetical protein
VKALTKHLSAWLLLCRTYYFLLCLFEIPKRGCEFTDGLQRESVSKQMKWTAIAVRTAELMKPVTGLKNTSNYEISEQFAIFQGV